VSRFADRVRSPRARLALLAAVVSAGAGAWAARDEAGPEPLLVRRGELLLTVDVDGELEAARASLLGPPSLPDTEFKIAFLAPEGRLVKRGDPVLGFDPQLLETALEAKQAELEEVTQRLTQKSAASKMTGLEAEEELAKARAELVKARLKADVPPELMARVELITAQLEAQGKAREVEQIEARRGAEQAALEAELDSLRAQRERARARVQDLRAGIAALTVRAPQDGIVVHSSDWRDEKKKVGDAVWMLETVVELPDLSEMKALGDVDEADAGQVVPGQSVRLRLESREDVDLAGRVRSLGRNVRRRSWRVPGKVFRVEIALDRSDPQVMRPAMRFRGQIEVGRVPDVVLVPREAVFLRDGGPVAWVRRLTGFEERPLRLGRRNAREIEVLGGLEPGQRVSPVDLALAAPTPAGGGAP
jgi:HlyD family secretion protein